MEAWPSVAWTRWTGALRPLTDEEASGSFPADERAPRHLRPAMGGAQPERLSTPVRALLLDPDTELTVSVVTAWEMALKPELGIDDVGALVPGGRPPSPRAHSAGPP